MKKLLLVFGIIFSSICFAQTDEQQQVLEDVQSFSASFENRDYNKILDMSYPVLLEKFDKKTLVNAFKTMLEGNEDFLIKIEKADDESYQISEIYNGKGKTKYAFVSFPMVMEMKFLKKVLDDDIQKLMTNTMEQQGMKAKFLDQQTMQIEKLSLTVAINDKATKHTWKYLNHDENNPLYTTIVSQDIIAKAKEYYAELQQK